MLYRVCAQHSAGALTQLGNRHVRDFHFTPVRGDSQFLSLSFKNIPESFVSYCQAALQKEHQSSSTESLDVYSYHGVTAYALEHDILTVSYSDVRESGAVFNGAHLFIAHIP